MKDGGGIIPDNATPCPTGFRKSLELDIFLLHGLNSSKWLCSLVTKGSESMNIPACNSGLGFSMQKVQLLGFEYLLFCEYFTIYI